MFDYTYINSICPGGNLFDADVMFVPFNMPGLHYTGAYVIFKKKTIVYVDSSVSSDGPIDDHRPYALALFLKDHWSKLRVDGKLMGDCELSEWTLATGTMKQGELQVDDGVNCGVFQCVYADQFCSGGQRVTIGSGNIWNARKRLLILLWERRNIRELYLT